MKEMEGNMQKKMEKITFFLNFHYKEKQLFFRKKLSFFRFLKFANFL